MLLSDSINLPIDITLVCTLKVVSTPSLLNNSPPKFLQKTKSTSSGKSHIDQKFDQTALNHLKSQVLTEIKNKLDNNNTNIVKIGSKVLGTKITAL